MRGVWGVIVRIRLCRCPLCGGCQVALTFPPGVGGECGAVLWMSLWIVVYLLFIFFLVLGLLCRVALPYLGLVSLRVGLAARTLTTG